MKKGLLLICFFLGFQTLFAQVSGQPNYLAILVQFKDVSFTLEEPASLFEGMLNGQGFDYEGATGSVADYYSDNSFGRYRPSFDVYGPVTLEGRMRDYGRDVIEHGERVRDVAPEWAVLEACRQLDEDVDFSVYDADGDGFADLVVVIYAGYDQAAGGKADAIWSQQWNMQNYDEEEIKDASFDGVRLAQYITTPELQGAEGEALASIGPLCHEMGHFLGLPDFYDTDGAQEGNAGGLYAFSLMGRGLYNNGGHTPPSLNAVEKSLLGWLEEAALPELPKGDVRLASGDVYVSHTQTEGEYFLYEFRSGTGWDAPLPKGLVIYHVDRSQRTVGDRTALQLWEDWRDRNAVNARAAHPCFRLVPASRPEMLAYDATLENGRMVYPGEDGMLAYVPVDWEGSLVGVGLSGIVLEEDAVHFTVGGAAGKILSKYDRSDRTGYYPSASVLGAVRFTDNELYQFVGQELTKVYFYSYIQSEFEEDIYLTIDLDGERVLNRKLENLLKGPYIRQEVDLSDAHLIIPEGKALYIGIGSPSAGEGFRLGTVYPATKGNSFISDFSLERSSWKDMYVKSQGTYMDLALSAVSREKSEAQSLTDLGYSYIEPPQGRLKEGETYPLVLHAAQEVTSVNWSLDGSPVRGNSIVLKLGTQTIHARLQYADGRDEVLELLLKVN